MKRQAVLINGAISAAILGIATFIAANSALKISKLRKVTLRKSSMIVKNDNK